MKQHLPALCLALLLAACGEQAALPIAAQAENNAAPTFVSATVAEVAIHPERSAPAAVVGKHEARLSAEVAATIQALPVDVGQTVRKGAVVARLDPRDAELALERAAAVQAQAQAGLALARAQYERARTLREKNFLSAEALNLRATEQVAAQADLRAANAQLETARRVLDKHTLRAPFAAVVRTRSGQVGELATPGTALLTLVTERELELAAQLQPHTAASLQAAAAPRFVSQDNAYALKLLRISPAVDRASRSVEARLAFVGLPPAAGSEGRLVWRETQAYLPAELLVQRAGHLGVFVAVDGKARFHALPQAQEGRPAALDLPAETQVVTQGRHALQDGQPLR